MVSISLKIDKRTKAAKALLSIIELFAKQNKGVEICNIPNFETIKAMYDAERKLNVMDTKGSKDLFEKTGI